MSDTLLTPSHHAGGPILLSPEQLKDLAAEMLKLIDDQRQASSSAPSSAKATTEAKTDSAGIKRAIDFEIRAARRRLGQMSPENIVRSIPSLLVNGETNPHYNAMLNKQLIYALSRLSGNDPTWDAYWGQPGNDARGQA